MKFVKIISILVISFIYQRAGTKRYDGQGVRVNNSLNADEKKMTFTRSHLGAVLGGTTGV